MQLFRNIVRILWAGTFLLVYNSVTPDWSSHDKILATIIQAKGSIDQEKLIELLVEMGQIQEKIRNVTWLGLFLFTVYFLLLNSNRRPTNMSTIAHIFCVGWCFFAGFR